MPKYYFEAIDPKKVKPMKYFNWTPWFAWYPVKVGINWVWLKKIQKRAAFRIDSKYEYRLLEKIK